MKSEMWEGLSYCLKALVDLLVPRACVVCGGALDVREEHLCTACLSDLPLTYSWISAHNPVADRYNEMIQRHLQAYEPYQYAMSLFFYSYDNGYKEIVHGLKYSGNLALGRHFAVMLGQHLSASPDFSDVDLIVPVPLHPLRRLRRGYNQAEVISRALAPYLSATLATNLIRRRRRTTTQTRLSVEQKQSNVNSAFVVNERVVLKMKKARHILLVDDVFTTGATLCACHDALRAVCGEEIRISAATLAFVQGV